MARKILRLPTVSDRTGLSFSSIYKQIRLGEFPRGIKLTARATGWDEEAVQGWIEAKLRGASDEEIAKLVSDLENKRVSE
jgi:prophage regulatory protein